MKRTRIALRAWIVVAGLLGLGASYPWWSRLQGESATPRYQTVTLKRADIVRTVTATGQLSAVVNVQVGSQISGNIEKLFADFNTPVKAGQIVAQLDPSTYRAMVMAAEGELESAQANVALARLTEKRKRQLVTENAAAPADLDRAVADLDQAEAMVKIRQAALERARVDLERCTITAPVDGIVISRNVDVGQTVAASLQAPVLFTIANDLTRMNIEAHVSEADIGGVGEGQSATFSVDAFPERVFSGKVVQVRYAPVIIDNVVSYVTVIEVSNPQLELRPGMTANVSIELDRRNGALALPNAVLRFRPPAEAASSQSRKKEPNDGRPKKPKGPAARHTVYRLNGRELEPVEVTLGINDAVTTEVTQGLEEGAVLVSGIIPAKVPAAAQAMNPFGGNGAANAVPRGPGPGPGPGR